MKYEFSEGEHAIARVFKDKHALSMGFSLKLARDAVMAMELVKLRIEDREKNTK